jgi:tRNA pseudouridine55 synthase
MTPTRARATRDLRGGVLVVDKPPGPTSHDIVHVVRLALGHPRIGHTGTLDPFATGVLGLVVGRATRLAQFFADADKEYTARIRLGTATDTYDATGSVTFAAPGGTPWPDAVALRTALAGFEGTRDQMPPPFSAKKSGGIPAYERARQGHAVELRPARVTAHALELRAADGADLEVRVHCSAGFYVRSLAHDLGSALGLGGHLVGLRRTRSGTFTEAEAVGLELVLLDPDDAIARLVPLEALLTEWPGLVLDEEGAHRVRHGLPVGRSHIRAWPGGDLPQRARLLGPDGLLLAVADRQPGGVLHPGLVLG